jgi:hypothetical protein
MDPSFDVSVPSTDEVAGVVVMPVVGEEVPLSVRVDTAEDVAESDCVELWPGVESLPSGQPARSATQGGKSGRNETMHGFVGRCLGTCQPVRFWYVDRMGRSPMMSEPMASCAENIEVLLSLR